MCCSPWGHKESDTTEQLKSNNRGYFQIKPKGIFHGSRCEITKDKPNNNPSLCIQIGNCKNIQLPDNDKVVWYLSKFLIFHSHIFKSFGTPWESELSEILSLKNTFWSWKIKASNFLGVKKGPFPRYWNPNFGIRVSKSRESDKICVKEKCLESVNYILVLICWYNSLIYSSGRRFSCEVWCIGGLDVTESEKVKSMI